MRDKPLVSIVTNAYNQGQFLRTCIESVLGQSYKSIEFIVIDPGSTDETAEILKEYEGRITIIRERDNGPADGLNKGFAIASGEIFGYLNADDLYLKDAVQRAVDEFERSNDVAAVYAGGYVCNAHGTVTKRLESTPLTLARFRRGNFMILQQSTFYRRKDFFEIGGFNLKNGTSWDLELLVDFLQKGKKLRRVDGAWSVFMIHTESITGSQRFRSQSIANHNRIFQKIFGRPPTQWERMTRNAWGKTIKLERPLKFLQGNILTPKKRLHISRLEK